jgi:hypothetical protein
MKGPGFYYRKGLKQEEFKNLKEINNRKRLKVGKVDCIYDR